jgi:hypothetical protein
MSTGEGMKHSAVGERVKDGSSNLLLDSRRERPASYLSSKLHIRVLYVDIMIHPYHLHQKNRDLGSKASCHYTPVTRLLARSRCCFSVDRKNQDQNRRSNSHMSFHVDEL